MKSLVRALTGLVLAAAVLGAAAPQTKAADWTGRYSVLTPHAFSMQHLDYTCVGASVQMMLNIIHNETDHSRSAQKVYWRYGVDHNRYPASDNGVDPVGWVDALQNFGAGNYEINVASRYQQGLRELATHIRATGKPVGLFVHRGSHAWVMTGFEATADPATTSSFRVTAVEVMGPLFPYGTIAGKSYDPGPETWMTPDKLRVKYSTFQWSRAPEWSGSWLAVVPV